MANTIRKKYKIKGGTISESRKKQMESVKQAQLEVEKQKLDLEKISNKTKARLVKNKTN